MTSRERVAVALTHREPDRIPLDLGASPFTGMHVCSVYLLRQALKLDSPETPVKVIEPYQMLGEIKADLVEMLGIDVVGLIAPNTLFGFENEDWKSWTLFDGTPVLVPGKFNTVADASGDILQYPEGDASARPCARMPRGGFYFDTIIRQPPLDEKKMNPEDNTEEFRYVSDKDYEYFQKQSTELFSTTDKAIFASFGGSSFGDIALVPAPWLKNPRGIRDIEEWYISTVTRRDYVLKVFERQCEIALANLERLYDAIGDTVSVVVTSGTDFGIQTGSFIHRNTYRELFFPFNRQINDWIHHHTPWKTFIHTCGSVIDLIPDLIEAGFDILNPVQCSAQGMDPEILKNRFGKDLCFWGGGVDTQRVLPFGTPEEISKQIKERMAIFGRNGGFVFNTIHNIQAGIPVRNLLALYESAKKYRES